MLMRKYLLDTNIIGELFLKHRENIDAGVLNWFEQAYRTPDAELYVSTIVLMELYDGGLKLICEETPEDAAIGSAFQLFDACRKVRRFFGPDRIASLTEDVVEEFIRASIENAEYYYGHCIQNNDYNDLIIASTANALDAQAITRNLKHFRLYRLKYEAFNPFAS